MKYLILLGLSASLMLSLLACGGDDSSPGDTGKDTGLIWDVGNWDEKNWQ